MTLTVLASGKGSPGVTTTALALAAAWPRPVLLAECDPAGGDIAAGFLRASTPTRGGLLELALAARRGLVAPDVLRVCLSLSAPDQRVLLLAGLTDPAHGAALIPVWPEIVRTLKQLGSSDPSYDVLADVGRLPSAGLDSLLAAADRVLLVLRPTLAQIHHTRHRLAAVRRLRADETDTDTSSVSILMLGDRPYAAGEVEEALDAPVAAVLADDPRAAAALGDGTAGGRRFNTSALMRSARAAAAALRGAEHPHDRKQPAAWSETAVTAQHDGQRREQQPEHSDANGVPRR